MSPSQHSIRDPDVVDIIHRSLPDIGVVFREHRELVAATYGVDISRVRVADVEIGDDDNLLIDFAIITEEADA